MSVNTQCNSTPFPLPGARTRRETVAVAGAMTVAKGTLLGRLTAGGNFTPYVAGATDGSEIPKAVLLEALTFSGAGNQRAEILVKGEVYKDQLVIQLGTAISNVHTDLLRDYGIFAHDRIENTSTTNI